MKINKRKKKNTKIIHIVQQLMVKIRKKRYQLTKYIGKIKNGKKGSIMKIKQRKKNMKKLKIKNIHLSQK